MLVFGPRRLLLRGERTDIEMLIFIFASRSHRT
jgi:hypothetical protein